MSASPGFSRHYLWVLAIPLLVVSLWSEWLDYFSLWYDSIVYNHGYLVLAGTLYLLYVRRDALRQLTINGSPLAIVLLAGASFALLLSQAADIRVFRLLLTPILILLWGWSIWGRDFLKVAGGPIMLLVFAAPVWDDFSPILQHITVFFNNIFLQLADIEATINEFLITLEVGAFLVEGGCSGVRYLMVALFLGAFYGQLYYRSFAAKAMLIIAAGLFSLLANWIRVFGIIAAGHYTNMETSLVEDHELFGWVIFIIFTLLPVFFISSRLEGDSRGSPEKNGSKEPSSQPTAKHTSTLWPIGASLLIIWPALVPIALEAKTEKVAQAWNPELVEGGSDWRGPLKHANVWQPEFSRPDIDLSGVYVSEDLKQVQLQITGYRNQNQNKELIFYKNQLFDSSDWRLVSTAKRDLGDAYLLSPNRINETVIQNRQDRSQVIVWSWYDVGGFLTDSKLEAKVAGALKKITGDSRGALWALAGRCEVSQSSGCEQQRQAFTRFLDSTLQ
ncbi:exosortase A [Marinobacter sp. F4206]|uniref:exosortase A n=1 Tax=Marinobacter sp. F4206 TaxID=2861777 RepID=UPI001C5D1BF4|nr:exosortase A [Marinobacter sp. F4206]MBW4933386.1 EpsI family protein [Marinobacter sp. F4206]